MPQVNPLARELVFKVVYYGPGLGGKTTSLQHVHATTRPEHRGKMVSLATPVDRTLYFDFLPIRVPTSRNMTVRLQLFTVPGQVYYNATRKLVLTGADGVVFVADSQLERADANVESFRNLEENLAEHGRGLDEMPHVFAYNKRDLSDLTPIDEMEQLLNSRGAPSFATVATLGEGVYEALEAITRAVLEDFDQRVPEHRGLSPSPLMLPEGGLAEALRGVDASPDSWDIPPERPRAKVSLGSELGLSMPPDDDVGEQAARNVLAPGARPFGGHDASDSPIDLRRAKRRSDAPRSGQSDSLRFPDSGDETTRASETFEAEAQSHWRPVPVPLSGIGMRSSPPPASNADAVPPSDEVSEEERARSVEPTSVQQETFAEASEAPTRDSFEEEFTGCSLSLLWPDDECSTVIRVEQAIAQGETRDAVLLAEVLVERSFEDLSTRLGRHGVDPAVWSMLLGLRGDSYIDFLRLVDRAKSTKAKLSKVEALGALLFATNLCVAKRRATSQSLG